MCITNGDIFSITTIWVDSVAHERAKITANKYNDGFQPRTWINDNKKHTLLDLSLQIYFTVNLKRYWSSKLDYSRSKGCDRTEAVISSTASGKSLTCNFPEIFSNLHTTNFDAAYNTVDP